jgi:hypothetical protein
MIHSVNYVFPEDKKIKAMVDTGIFHNAQPVGDLVPCEIVGLNMYDGHMPCFTIISNGCMFDYVPVTHVFHREMSPDIVFKGDDEALIGLMKTLTYGNTKGPDFITCVYPDIKPGKSKAYFRGTANEIVREEILAYYLSIDWLESNDKRHLVMTESGYFAFVPNHKLSVDGGELPKDWKKLKLVFKE